MPWPSNESKGSSDGRSEASISDILPTAAHRTELLLLVVLCTDAMRDDLAAVFDAPITSGQDEGDWPGRDRIQPPGNARPFSPRELELQSSQIQGLKRASITFFNAWRTNVLRRLGEKLQVRSEAVKQAKVKYLATQEAATRERKKRAYYDWADGKDPEEHPENSSQPTQTKNIPTKLQNMEQEKRVLILHCCLLIILSLENYVAHSRVLLCHISRSLSLTPEILPNDEAIVAQSLLETASAKMAADDATKQKAAEDATARRWKVGLATVAGAAVVGITGGLAAPFLLGVGGAIMGGVGLGGLASLLGATIANPLTVAALFGAMGGRMTGRAVEEYEREIRDFKFVPLSESTQSDPRSGSREQPQSQGSDSSHKLRVVIGISGWLTEESEITSPWTVFQGKSVEAFALRYERSVLLRQGKSLTSILQNSAYSLAQASFLQLALPAVIATAMLPVTLLRAGSYLNNPFSLGMERSDKAGKVLATALMAKAQGERPVSLVGYSLGARVIFSCLIELAAQNAFGLVENVVLLGAPAPSDTLAWRKIRSVVAGRVINIFATNDLLLAILYRTIKAQIGVAGLQPISDVFGVENIDATKMVHGHHQYRLALGPLLQQAGFEDIDREQVLRQQKELEREDQAEKEIHERAKQRGELTDLEDESGRIIMTDATKVEQREHDPHKEQSTGHSAVSQSISRPGQGSNISEGKDAASTAHRQPSHDLLDLEESHSEARTQHDSDDDLPPRIQMLELDPEPVSDSEDTGPQKETVHFGGSGRERDGFDVVWKHRA